MKKVVLIPDSFKGTISSQEVCEIVARQVLRFHPEAEVISIPVADGGEGTVDCFLLSQPGERVSAQVKGPYFEDITADYALLDGGKTAVVEIASCAGLPMVDGRKNPKMTTTYGFGQLILDAARRGATRIVAALGGSCTNDCACGMAAALGVAFYNEAGEPFIPTGGTLRDIWRIDRSGLANELSGVEIVAMCDIDNPMYGATGAAYVFGPQKGADGAMVEELDQGLRHLSQVLIRDLGVDVAQLPGAGAAGAAGAGVVAFLGGSLEKGIDVVLDAVKFEELIADADLIFTGEGKLDTQSIRGKVVVGVSRRAKDSGVPVIAIVGDVGDGIGAVYDLGVSAVFSTNQIAVPFEEARLRAKEDLAATAENVARFAQLFTR